MSKFLNEFKTFALRGNVVDMAVGVIIGGAFGKIVTSLVNDILMPPISVLIGGADFSELKIIIRRAIMEGETVVKPELSIHWGNFVQVVVDFIILAFCIFLVVKGINKMQNLKKKEEEAPAAPEPPKPSNEEVLLTEIRDLLKNK